MESSLPDEVVQQATDLFYSCNPVNDPQGGEPYLPLSELDRINSLGSNNPMKFDTKELEMTLRLLDLNQDGKLTLEEFVNGYGQFLSKLGKPRRTSQPRRSIVSHAKEFEAFSETERVRRNSTNAIGTLQTFFKSSLYEELRNQMPTAVVEFEALIKQATKELQDVEKSVEKIEANFATQTGGYHESLEQAYVQLDSNIAKEEEASKQRLDKKFDQLTLEFKQLIAVKTEHVNEIQQKLHELLQRKEEAMQQQTEDQKQIQEIRSSFDKLFESIEETEQLLKESKLTIDDLQKAAKSEHVKYKKTDASTCEKVQMECEDLMRELDQLRESNRRLRDERDEALHEHRLRDLITQSSLQDEVNEVHGREVETAKCEIAQGQCATQNLIMNGITSVNGSASRNDAADIGPASISDFSEDDYEFETPWKNTDKISSVDNNTNIMIPRTKKAVCGQNKENEPDNEHMAETRTIMNKDLQTVQQQINEVMTFKILVIGRTNVGKTVILDQICGKQDFFLGDAQTFVNLRIASIDVDGIQTIIHFWEITINEKLKSMCSYLLRTVDGIILVYDINSMKDFNELDSKFSNLAKLFKNRHQVVKETVNLLLGNKLDLVADPERTPVPRGSSNGLAKRVNASSFLVSGLTGQNLDEAINDFVRRLRASHEAKMNMKEDVETSLTESTPGCINCCSM